MILAWLLMIPAAGGFLAWRAGRLSGRWPRWISLAATAIDLLLSVAIWAGGSNDPSAPRAWLASLRWDWVPSLGITFHLAMDGLSLLLVLLTAFVGVVTVIAFWHEQRASVGFFHANLLWTLTGILGVFLAMDLFLFYFFWELMLVPMFLLIQLWGDEPAGPPGEVRGLRLPADARPPTSAPQGAAGTSALPGPSPAGRAAIKFFLFTQLSGLLMLLAILGLYFVHGRATGTYTFDYPLLLGTSLPGPVALWLFLGFIAAFFVKLPAVAVHAWQPDAYTQAPPAGAIILAALMSKTAAYGLIRFAIPLFPQAAADFAPAGMIVGVAGILYGGWLALAQDDFKRLIAYASLSHMGFLLLGIFAWNRLALEGVVIQILSHGISVTGLFVVAGLLEERLGTRDMRSLGGLWSVVPGLGAVTMFFVLATLSLPGMGSFVGEFLVLLGTWRASVPLAVIASSGIIISVIYSLSIIQRIFHGPRREGLAMADVGHRHMAALVMMMAVLLWLGLYPLPFLLAAGGPLQRMHGGGS